MKSLRQARQAKGYTLDNLAALSGCTKPHLSWIENGKVLPSIPIRYRIEQSLGERINWLAPPIKVEARYPPCRWEDCERSFRYLVKMIASLPPEERVAFCVSAKRQLLLVEKAEI